VLVPEIASGAAAEAADLRAACRTAIRRIAVPGGRLVVVGTGPTSAPHDARARGSFAGFGVTLEVPLGSDEPGPVELPPSLAVGAWLVRDALGADSGAIGYSLGPDGAGLPVFDDDRPVVLVVMGDGSARRSTAAPGYLDDRASAFDAGVAGALASGDARRLHVDAGLGDELLATGPRAWAAVAGQLEPFSWAAELLYDAAPYGVGYFVAAWTARG
jgi:hypothetical protein